MDAADNNVDRYAPCPCGSGKKGKFCCLQKGSAGKSTTLNVMRFEPLKAAVLEDDPDDKLLVGGSPETRAMLLRGLTLMMREKFGKAISVFRKIVRLDPAFYTAGNNLAACLYASGKLDEAIQTQRVVLEGSSLPNPFGLASLASFMYISGDEEESRRLLDEALILDLPSADACIRVCETLARFERHQDILDTADRCRFGDSPGTLYFTGIAAANLGDRQRAERDLRRVPLDYPRGEQAEECLRRLARGSPGTIRGNWPYLLSYEICALSAITAEFERNAETIMSRRMILDYGEALAHECPDEPEVAFHMLRFAAHPESTALLKAIVQGDAGTRELRLMALQCLQDRGDLGCGQSGEMKIDGVSVKMLPVGVRLVPDYCLCPHELPSELVELYEKTVKAGLGKKPDWTACIRAYERILREAPEYFPAHHNQAVCLVHLDRCEEAENILRELVSEHPDYIFAHAKLLHLLCEEKRMTEADALVQSVVLPEETHPDAMVAWMVALSVFHKYTDRFKEAILFLEVASQIDPDNPVVPHLLAQVY